MLLRSIGSYRGDKNKWFPTNCVRFLTQDELLYIKEVVSLADILLRIYITFSYNLQHTDSSDEHQKIVCDVHIIDFTKQSLSISKYNNILFAYLFKRIFLFRCHSFF